MMLLRTLVLERSGADAPVNGALLCGFAVDQTGSNFLVYSLDEETEPGHSRVYIAVLRKKLERYFLAGVDSKEDLQVAMQVFKQILVAAASGTKASAGADPQVPFHFIDLKGCRLPPARPEDHHSLIIKKALVMKVITLGMSAPTLPPIESNAVIVPSIRFSSQMVTPPRSSSSSKAAPALLDDGAVDEPPKPLAEPPEVMAEARMAPALLEQSEASPARLPARTEHASLLEMDSTLTNLAKVAQELAQKKSALLEQEAMLEQWQVRLQHQQSQVEERSHELEQRHAQLQRQESEVRQRTERLATMRSQLSGMRQHLQGALLELDQVLDGQE